jgi:hypothetical protein
MLQNTIMRGLIGKWAYALIEYDLAYESLKSMCCSLFSNTIHQEQSNTIVND